MIADGSKYLVDLMGVFNQINQVYRYVLYSNIILFYAFDISFMLKRSRKQADLDLVKQTGQSSNLSDCCSTVTDKNITHRVVITQQDMYTNVLQYFAEASHIVQVSDR